MPNEHVLENFVISDNSEFAKCNLCGKWLKYLRTSSSLLYHIQKVHGISSSPRNSDEGNGGRDNIDSMPNTPNDDATPAKRPRTLTYDRKRSMPPHDAWTSTATVSYVTATSHHLNDDFELLSYTIDTFELSEKHSHENLMKSLEKVTSNCGIRGRIKATVHDNARNITKAVRESNLLGDSVPCFAHTLQLALKNALLCAEKVTDKATKIVGHFRHSAIETAALKAQQKIFGLPEHKLEQSCKTRWNSTYKMLKRLLEQRSAVESVLKEFSNVNLKLTEEEWNEISALSSILEPFDITTTLMSSQTKVTLSMVRPLVFRLKDNFLRESTADTEMMKEFKRVLNQGLTNWILQKTSAANEEPSCALIAQFLDPRYKNLRCETEDNKNIVISKITTLLESLHYEISNNNSYTREEVALNFLFFGTRTSEPQQQTTCEELQIYKQEAEINININPLNWWRENKNRFPSLSKVARKYLAIPATSVPSEKVFSTAGDIITTERSRLLPENAGMLIFLSENANLL